jgi:hypothetical protein
VPLSQYAVCHDGLNVEVFSPLVTVMVFVSERKQVRFVIIRATVVSVVINITVKQ